MVIQELETRNIVGLDTYYNIFSKLICDIISIPVVLNLYFYLFFFFPNQPKHEHPDVVSMRISASASSIGVGVRDGLDLVFISIVSPIDIKPPCLLCPNSSSLSLLFNN